MSAKLRIVGSGFKPDARGAGHVLGELQTAVMEILWGEPGLTVNEVEEKLQHHREIAHTTVLTTLDRMHRKGYLRREKCGKAFVYEPRYSREEFALGMTQEVLGALLDQFSESAISTFVDMVSEDSKALDQLETMLREKRKAIEKNRKK